MRLIRVAQNLVATYGVWVHDRTPFAVSLERPWKNNERGVSCIPAGVYECRRVTSPKFGDTFEVTGVAGRSEILIHKGNIDDDTHGCILIGEAFNPVLSKPGITDSGHALAELMTLMRMTDRFALSVIDAFDKYMLNAPLPEQLG
jgi:hypothetical protein